MINPLAPNLVYQVDRASESEHRIMEPLRLRQTRNVPRRQRERAHTLRAEIRRVLRHSLNHAT
jgi:hypothetical protein